MNKVIKSLKRINLRLYLALLILGLCPAIYTTLRTFFLGQLPGEWSYSIAGQLSWVNLIYEIVNEAIILPLFFFIGKVVSDKTEFANRVRTGLLISLVVYSALSALILLALIALKLKDLFNNEKTVETLPIGPLNELIRRQRLRGDANVMFASIERLRRLTMPFSALILTVIGVSLSARKRRGGIGWNIGIGIALAFSYIFFMRVSEMFVYTDTLPPGIALWLPNVLYAVIAFFLYKRACK